MRTIILDDPVPPVREVAEYGATAVAIYCLMYESAFMDKRFDKNRHLPWEQRRDCGGLCRWSHKAISDTLGIGKKTLLEKIALLLDAGYIQVEGMEMGSKVSHQRIYRVTHPNSLEARRAAIELMPEKPSITAKKKANYFNEKHPKNTRKTSMRLRQANTAVIQLPFDQLKYEQNKLNASLLLDISA